MTLSLGRRRFLRGALGVGVGITLARSSVPLAGSASPAEAMQRIGHVSGGSLETSDVVDFRGALREVGRVDGTSVFIDTRTADGMPDRLPGLIDELLRLRPQLLVTVGTLATTAAKGATTTTPIVFYRVTDPVAQGIVVSLSRPGGNITGVAAGPAPGPKRLELLLALNSDVQTVAVLWNANNSGAAMQLRDTEAAAKTLGLKLQIYGIHNTAELDTALDSIALLRPGAIHVEAAFNLSRVTSQIPEFAAHMRMPATYPTDADFVGAGGLLALGANTGAIARRAASLADRVLKGERPADLPVEFPTQLDLIVNLKAAERIGLVIPPSLVRQASKVVR